MILGYRSTALLIWHKKDNFEIIDEDVEQYMEEHLGDISSVTPTNDETEAFDYLVEWMRGHPGDESFDSVLQTLNRASIHWKGSKLWIKACKAGGVDRDMRLLSMPLILEGLAVFGFEPIGGLYV